MSVAQKNHGKRKIVKTYDYVDKDNKLLFQAVRYVPKAFKQRRPDGHGDWIWDLKGVDRVLYRLPEVLKAETVLIFEGEKDADLANTLITKCLPKSDTTATTSPMGAKKWRKEYTESLRNKDVVLIPDNDPVGKEHMEKVRDSLKGVAKGIVWLDLPNLPPEGDFSDWLQACKKDKMTPDQVADDLMLQIQNAKSYFEKPKNPILGQESSNEIGRAEAEENPLEFPDVMSGLAGDFADLYSSYLESPRHFFYIGFLTCLGSILSGSLSLDSELKPQPRIFAVLLGESADDRKSTAINKCIDFFLNSTEFAVCWGVGSGEGLLRRFKNSSRLLLAFDEFRQFLSKSKIETSVLLPMINTLFEENNYEAWTKKTQVKLDNAHLSMLAASTTQTYQRTWDSSFTDIGFTNRLFIVPGSGKKRFSFPPKIPKVKIYDLRLRLNEVIEHCTQHPELGITEDAKNEYHSWYMDLPKSVHTKRLDTYALRFMVLMAVNGLKKEIDLETVQRVIFLCNWQLAIRQAYDPIDADTRMALVEESIRRVLKRKPRTKSELKKFTNANRYGIWLYSMAEKNLVEQEEIVWDLKKKKYFYSGE